jgi:type III pantothenate kinase
MVLTKTVVVDIGNTRNKAAVFEGDTFTEKLVFDSLNLEPLTELITKYQPVTSLVSSVGVDALAVTQLLKQHTKCYELSSSLEVPFKNLYATPQTLGMDRMAAVAGAMHFFVAKNCLVIDAGTCVTYDFITANAEYLGGAISPGLMMRLKAMAHFTQRLPEVTFELPQTYIGNSTQNSMLSGAYFGLLGEINDTITRYEEQFGEVQVLLCGGDTGLFDKHTKKSIFAAPDLVLYGLNKILLHNAT